MEACALTPAAISFVAARDSRAASLASPAASADSLHPAIALSAVTDISPQLCILLMGVLATAYTVMGGIAAVIWTDVLQVVVLIGGALVCLVIAVHDSGGVSAALETARAADKFHMFDWTWSTTDMVGWVLIVGFAFLVERPLGSLRTLMVLAAAGLGYIAYIALLVLMFRWGRWRCASAHEEGLRSRRWWAA